MKRFNIFADNLIAHEILHFLSGVIMFFILYGMFGQIKYGVIAFLASLLIDADHYFEGLIYSHFKICWIFSIYPSEFWKKTGKMTVLFHSWEFLPVILLTGKILNFWPLSISIVLPAVLHYLIDNFIYSGFRGMSIFQYFLIFRLSKKFSYKELCEKKY